MEKPRFLYAGFYCTDIITFYWNINSLLSLVFITMLYLFNLLTYCFPNPNSLQNEGKVVLNWVQGTKQSSSFSYAWCPSHASLTGTATLAMVKEITQILGMHEFFTVKATSSMPNIMYTHSRNNGNRAWWGSWKERTTDASHIWRGLIVFFFL